MRPLRVAVLAFPSVQPLDVAGPLEVFGSAGRWLRDNGRTPGLGYEVEILAPRRGALRTSSGFRLHADRSFRDVRGLDTLLVAGGLGVAKAAGDADLLRWLRRMATRVRRLGSVCTGAFLLAEAGLLDGRRAVTHWGSCDELARRYPRVRVEPEPLFVRDGGVFTSAGVTAGMDLSLALVEDDYGREVAQAVARELVLYVRRASGQPQLSAQLAAQLAGDDSVRELQAYIASHLAEDLSLERLASRAAMSPRNFSRVFAREVRVTPARFVLQSRLELARRLLEQTGEGLEAVASECGFRSPAVLRRALQRSTGLGPRSYRARVRTPSGSKPRA